MLLLQRILLIAIIFINGISLQAQNYKAERLKKAAVDAGAASVMTSFNTVDYIPATGNKWLPTM